MVICGPCWGVGGRGRRGRGGGSLVPPSRQMQLPFLWSAWFWGGSGFLAFRMSADSGPILAASSRRPGNVGGTPRARGGVGELSGKGGDGSPRARGFRPQVRCSSTADRGLLRWEPPSRETEAATGKAGGRGKYCKAKLGEPEDVHSKGRGCFAASEAAGMETPKARTLAVGFAAGSLCGQPGSERRYENVGRGRVLG